MERFPSFQAEWQSLSHEAVSKATENILQSMLDFADEYCKLFAAPSHAPPSNNMSLASEGSASPLPSLKNRASGGADSLTDLQKLADKSMDYGEWARMTLRVKMSTYGTTTGRSRKRPDATNLFSLPDGEEDGNVQPDMNAENELLASVEPFAESVIELIIFAHESMYDASKDKDSAMLQSAVTGMGHTLQAIFTQCEELGNFQPDHRIAKILEGAMTAVQEFSTQTRGRLDDGLLAAASGSISMRNLVESSLELRVHMESNGARVLAVQLMATMIATAANRKDNTNYLQVGVRGCSTRIHANGILVQCR